VRLSRHLSLLALALVALAPAAGAIDGLDVPTGAEHVSMARLLAAMNHVQGYELAPTTNGARLQADVLRELILEHEANDPEERPLFIGHGEWYEAFLARTGIDSTKAPLYIRVSYDIGQDMLVDYRRGQVVEAVLQGPTPRFAADVRLFWKGAAKPDQFGYDDLFSRPHLRVTEKRLVSYRMVDYADRLWYTEVRGLRGRPTSGPLGVLFDLIGEAKVDESRSAHVADGVQVVRGKASKWGFERTETMTVFRDGRVERGVPPERGDLQALEARLKEPLKVRFKPLPAGP